MARKPTIDEMVAHYEEKGLLAHPGVVKTIAEKVRPLPVDIPVEEIQRNMAFLSVWPLIEMFKLYQTGISRGLRKNERDNLGILMRKYQALAGDRQRIKGYPLPDEFRHSMRFFNTYIMGLVPFIKQIKAMAQDCELLENYLDRTKWSHRKLQHDSQMGGSLLVAGKEKVGKRAKARYTHYQRGFVCVRETGEPIILVDALQHHLGPDFRTLKLWRGGTFRPGTTEELIDENRMYEMYASVGAMMYLARKLDIRYIAMRDQPVNEFARALGMPERAIFKKSQDHWKIGLHSEKKWTGVHTNAIYRSGTGGPDGKKQLRYRTIEMFPFGNTSEMFTELERRAKDIIESNRGKARKAHRTSEKLEALTALYIIIQDFPLTSADARHRAYGIMQQAYRTLKQDVPTTVLFEPHAS